MPSSKTDNPKTIDDRYESPRYRRYVLFILTAVYALNFIDRQLLVILQEDIKLDLGLTDTQLGLLTGFAFALFYVTAGIPIARWADRSNRRNIISMSIGVWSAMTAVSGFATNYVQLLLARIGVALGEAGSTPPSHSMISDMYPPEKRATALGIYSMGINFGVLAGFLFGGILNEFFGWKVAFLAVGLPGILLALWVRFTVAEPIRGKFEKQLSPEGKEDIQPVSKVVKRCFKDPVVRYLILGASMCAFVGYASISWFAPFFIRSHGMGTAELGTWLAVASGIFGAISVFSAGYFSDKLGRSDQRWYPWIPAICLFLTAPALLFALLVTNTTQALIATCTFSLLANAYLPPTIALIHTRVEPRMRAMASAIVYFVLNIVGLGFGSPFIGYVSDRLSSEHGDDSLRVALITVLPAACVMATLLMLLAARHIKLEQANQN